MNFLKTLAIPGILLAITTTSFATSEVDFDFEKEKERLFFGEDWYNRIFGYYPTGPANFDVLYDRPEWIKSYRKNLQERAIDGEFFEPRAFWGQSMDDQLRYLKDEILSCNLLEIVKPHYSRLDVSFSSTPHGIAYKPEEEMAFREAVWPKIQQFITDHDLAPLTKEQFYDSLLINMKSTSGWRNSLDDAPLIRHFSRYLCPLWKRRITDGALHFDKYPSWFEMFIIGDKDPEELTK